MSRPPITFAAVCIVANLVLPPALGAEVFPDPGWTNPKLRFATGQVVKNRPEISPVLPAIPGEPSPWYVIQWHRDTRILPTDLRVQDTAIRDALFGVAAYAFDAADGMSHVHIFKNPANGSYVYELYEKNGAVIEGGGTSLLMSVAVIGPHPSWDRSIVIDLDARVKEGHIRYDTPTAEESGAVLGNAGMGLVMTNLAGGQGHFITLFDRSRLSPPVDTFLFIVPVPRGLNGNHIITTAHHADGSEMLPFAADSGPLHHLHYDMTEQFRFLSAQTYNCKDSQTGAVTEFSFPSWAMDPANWTLGSMYIGPEMENEDHRNRAVDHGPQGSVDLTLQLSNLHVTTQR